MYKIMLRRQTAMMPGYAVPAWMEEQTRHLPPEQQEIERARLFEVPPASQPRNNSGMIYTSVSFVLCALTFCLIG